MAIAPEIAKVDLPVIKEAIDREDFETAGHALRIFLSEHPNDPAGLFLLGRLYLEIHQPTMARIIYQRLVEHDPDRWQSWLNLGKACDQLRLHTEAEIAFRTVLEIDPSNLLAMVQMSTTLVAQVQPKEAIEWATKALAINDNVHARSNLGFAHLYLREYAEGWRHYEAGLGNIRHRTKHVYVGEPYWTGRMGKDVHVAYYTEQGIGDQIAGVEPLRDAIEQVHVVNLNCDQRMRNLFARSFPAIDVVSDWDGVVARMPDPPRIDYSATIYALHHHFRKSESDYPKTPFLVADPHRRAAVRGLLDSLGPEPKIGIAWSGGVIETGLSERRTNLETLLPMLKQPAQWVSLEYRDRSEQIADFQKRRGITIHDFPWLTRTDDYDNTAALVAELDMVVGVPTTVIHAAGGLGTPCICLVHPRPNVHYAAAGDRMPYYGSVELFRRSRNDEWPKQVAAANARLTDWLVGRRAA